FSKKGFPRKWPNVVCSDEATVRLVDEKWSMYGLGEFVQSPSAGARRLLREGKDEIVVSQD
ncbi:MAG TPA: hypothetical protein PL123_15075, partial [Bacteroidales bacterium]|nr:hypothetical protein [Bacteroidales bacterium]